MITKWKINEESLQRKKSRQCSNYVENLSEETTTLIYAYKSFQCKSVYATSVRKCSAWPHYCISPIYNHLLESSSFDFLHEWTLSTRTKTSNTSMKTLNIYGNCELTWIFVVSNKSLKLKVYQERPFFFLFRIKVHGWFFFY